jgi:drug/metabolite transporter (DMT)-like permease
MLVFAIIFRKNLLKTNLKMWLTALVYALTLMTFVKATKMTTAANAIFLQFTAPIYVLVLEPVIFKIKLLRINLITVLICIFGMSLFFVGNFEGGKLTGNLLGLISGIFFAAFILGQRLNEPAKHGPAIFWGNFLICLASINSAVEIGLPPAKPFLMLLFLGIFQIGIAYTLFTYGLQRTLGIEAGLLGFIEPILNPIWVWLGYGEFPGIWAIFGGLIILITLAVKTIFFENQNTTN